jgi:hypothetical protein
MGTASARPGSDTTERKSRRDASSADSIESMAQYLMAVGRLANSSYGITAA